MRAKPVSRLTNRVLLRKFEALLSQERTALAELLSVLGEIDARELFLPAGYPSMYAFCVGAYHLSEDAAYKRIRAARAARRHPMLLAAIADGRLHLSALYVIVPHLTPGNVREFIEAATHRTRKQVEVFLASRAPRPDVPERIERLLPEASLQLAPGPVALEVSVPVATSSGSAPGEIPAPEPVPGPVAAPAFHAPPPVAPARVTPLAPERYAVQFTAKQSLHEKMERARALLRHQVPDGNLADLMELAFDALIEKAERQKFAATSKPQKDVRRRSRNPRHIPAAIQREVWARDGARCTFVSDSGHRCQATGNLEFDHVQPIAKGGKSTPANLRLLCRAHNQYAAGEALGHGFMHEKRTSSTRAQATKAQKTGARSESARPRSLHSFSASGST